MKKTSASAPPTEATCGSGCRAVTVLGSLKSNSAMQHMWSNTRKAPIPRYGANRVRSTRKQTLEQVRHPQGFSNGREGGCGGCLLNDIQPWLIHGSDGGTSGASHKKGRDEVGVDSQCMWRSMPRHQRPCGQGLQDPVNARPAHALCPSAPQGNNSHCSLWSAKKRVRSCNWRNTNCKHSCLEFKHNDRSPRFFGCARSVPPRETPKNRTTRGAHWGAFDRRTAAMLQTKGNSSCATRGQAPETRSARRLFGSCAAALP